MARERRMKSDQIRTNWRDVLEYVRSGGTVIVEHYNRPVARVIPMEDPMTSTAARTITLVSATPGDAVPGVEISDPECPVEWADLPAAAREWAEEQGYGQDDSELLYVLGEGDEIPAGFPVYRVSPLGDTTGYIATVESACSGVPGE